MNRRLVYGLAIASLAVAAACSGGGGGSHTTPVAPATANANAGAIASGKIVLSIPNASPASTGRAPQFVSSAAVSATISINGGTATVYDLTAASSNCTGGPTTRTCTLAITSGSGAITVTITLFDAPGGTGHNLGSATGTATVSAPTPFSMTIDINPAVATALTPTATFGNGLPSITYKLLETGSFALTFKDASNTVIPSTNSSPFMAAVTLTSSDPHVTFGNTINNASQTAQISYDGNAAVGSTFIVTAKAGATTIGTFTMKTAGFLTEFGVPAGAGSQPSGIATGPDGKIWFTESFSNNIGFITIPGHVINDTFPIPSASTQPVAIAAGPPGDTRMWFSEGLGSSLGTIDTTAPVPMESPQGQTNWRGVTSFGVNTFYLNANNNDLEKYNQSSIFVSSSPLGVSCNPNFVAVGTDNMLWVTCNNENEIYIVNPGTMATSSVDITPFNATGIAAGPDSATWFVETTANKIGRIAIVGQAYTEYAIPTAASGAAGITQGPDGAMWFTEALVNKIGRIDVNTHQIVEFAVTAASSPTQIIAGPDGWLWFTEFGTGSLGRMQPPI